MDKGIDYSFGQSNFNTGTGIHYGVISQNSIMNEAMDDFVMDYGEPVCPECGGSVTDTLPDDGLEELRGYDYICLECRKGYDSDEVYGEESQGFTYEQDGYQLTNCLDNDIFVLKSPFYTFTQYCSPCVPGAGNLDTYIKDGVKTYALGHDWFDDGRAPYPLYSVETDKEVLPE